MPTIPKRLRQILRPRRRLAIAEACLIGLVAALASVLLKVGVGALGTMRVHISSNYPPYLVLPAIGLCFGFAAGLLVERLAPEAAGSGIPNVKAALAGVPMELSWRVAFVKLISSTIALGAGLTVGRQGPTVQVGAALAAQLSRWLPTSPDHRRQMIAAGAGAGLAAAFNAPLAGVLFVVEELLHDVSGFTLGTAILASFIGAVVSRLLGGRSLNLNSSQSFGPDLGSTAVQISFSMPEIPCYLVLGILAGIFGALFCRGIFVSLAFYKRTIRISLPGRIGLAGLVSGLALALLPDSFRDNTGLREFLLEGDASWQMAAIAFAAQFILTLIAFGSQAPGGLFAPSLILGSALGYLVGLLATHFLGLGTPITYALAGMGAFFSAVSKVPITAIVIVFEMTTNFDLVLPLMIASVTSYLVAEMIAPRSLYDRLLEWNGIYLDKETPKGGILGDIKALDVMQRRVETLSSQMILDEVVQAFSRSHHRGFPVVDDGKLIGIVTQTDLAKISQLQLSGNTPLSKIMTAQPVTIGPKASLADVLYLLNRYQLSRLPVIEGRKLIGIITRADIIRAEADQMEGKGIASRPEISYVVYQTRSPAVGKGRLLVPLANPQTAPSLLRLAGAIALDRDYELECLQVMLAPRHSSPSETSVRTAKSRRLLRQAEILGRQLGLSVHTQVRVAHDAAQAILETIKQEHIDLIVMGWNAEPPTPGRIFGSVVDTVIRQASCDVILVKLGTLDWEAKEQANDSQSTIQYLKWNRWLVPMAGGPNAQQAIQLLPALCTLSDRSEIRLTQVFLPSQTQSNTDELEQAALFLRRKISCPVVIAPVCGRSVPETVIDLADKEQCDVIVLGASREGMLQLAIRGNIPEAIARGCDCTVILVRGAIA
ncbi:chloride channel protein [Argonema galeatum]|uniref:chloride channel protein n=1 Tax=Argonema galeatum TaxID=2942762 RepID=UPI0020120F94|nr:chloride channel protein [Argonema galeatum]MCL1468333.1 chloride channel protein [Argonema galeatum A003/A1]